MSITSSLFSGISGLSALGTSMQVIGDNIANINTVGFKGSRATFQDVLAQTISTVAGTSQVGRGCALSNVSGLFQQGSFESTEEPTDLAIGGKGFFMVRSPDTASIYYTRAGQFRFDNDGYFVNPAGYVVQGWGLDENGEDTGSIGDIQLTSFSSAPAATSKVQIIVQLDSRKTSQTTDHLSGRWNGSQTTPIASTAYIYQTSSKAYDSLGTSHDLTIYFDRHDTNNNTWEFIVTCNPDEDQRTGYPDVLKGLLARGTITFNTAGAITDLDTEIYDSTITQSVTGEAVGTGDGTTTIFYLNNPPIEAGSYTVYVDGTAQTEGTDYSMDTDTGTITFLAGSIPAAGQAVTADYDHHWTDATTSSSGYDQFIANFTGMDQTIDLNLGTRWDGSSWANEALSSTQYASASATIFQTQNGYGSGFLESVSVDTDGVITGHYSNGQVTALYRVALANFNNPWGLSKEGGNLFGVTRASGDPITGRPGTNGVGRISPNSLEQSNVDLANEFVKMIVNQRGFQANSKIITTVDTMLEELIRLKR